MRSLSYSECSVVAGGRPPLQDRLARDTTIGAGLGSVVGIIATNTMAGAAYGGGFGAAAGFSFGTGYAIGLAINDYVVEPILDRLSDPTWLMRPSS
jgi:hypothetical protein